MTQESLGRKPDCLGVSKLLFSRDRKISLKMVLLNIFPQIGKRETGWYIIIKRAFCHSFYGLVCETFSKYLENFYDQ